MLLVDVDAFCKLAHWKILPHLSKLLGIPWQNIATISSLRFRARRALAKPDGKLFRNTEAAKLVLETMELLGQLDEPSPETLALFEGVPQIDVGEAILLSLVADEPSLHILTGDKKALRSLASHECANLVSGRVITLEQIMLLCLERMGESWFKKHVCPFKEIDTSIRVVMGGLCNNSVYELRLGLTSYINEIARLRTPPLLKNT